MKSQTKSLTKFTLGSETDQEWCDALTDEAEECILAFKRFERLGCLLIHGGKVSRQANKAYFGFLQHLYEWYKGAFIRERGNRRWAETEAKKQGIAVYDVLDGAFAVEAHRQVQRRLQAIKAGTAPIWENNASYYEKLLLVFTTGGQFCRQFGKDFRDARNNIHVSSTRTHLDLSDYYHKYHGVMWLLYCDLVTWKGENVSTIGSKFTL
jgi:hypothetical protein